MKIRSQFLMGLCFVFADASKAQPAKTPVFVSGTDGYASYRIPAIIRTPDNQLLAFCEGRVNGSNDFGNIQIVMKRSSDGGLTWSRLQVVAGNGSLQAGNAAPVVDLTDPAYPQGRIFLFYCTGDQPESAIRKGHGVRQVWYTTSTDNGLTWDAPVNITTQVHRPNQPAENPAYRFTEDWRCYATTPGHAMQLRTGTHAGRILVPINYSSGDPQPHFTDFRAADFYTDDHGRSWHLGDAVTIPGGNEDMGADAGQGTVMLTIRNQRGDIRRRIIAISRNGGQSWDTAYFDPRLPDPVCQGSILTVGYKKGRGILAICNNDDTVHRNNLTLRISFDQGKTWTRRQVIDRSDDPAAMRDHTAYSDLVGVDKRTIGVLYERGNYTEITFTILKWQ